MKILQGRHAYRKNGSTTRMTTSLASTDDGHCVRPRPLFLVVALGIPKRPKNTSGYYPLATGARRASWRDWQGATFIFWTRGRKMARENVVFGHLGKKIANGLDHCWRGSFSIILIPLGSVPTKAFVQKRNTLFLRNTHLFPSNMLKLESW